jgi:gas vesicle protein
MGKFKKGVFFGGVLGAALVWLNTSTKGKKYRDVLLDQAADVYRDVQERIEESGAMEKITKNKYLSIVREAVDKYAIKNGMAESAKNMIVKLVSSQWNNVKKQMKK